MLGRQLSALKRLCCLAALLLAGCSGQDQSLLLSFTTDAPTGLSASADDRDISVSWNAVDNADSYTLFRYTNSNCAALPENFADCDNASRWQGLTATTMQDTNLINDQVYYYKVIAQSDDGDSSLSEQASARTAPATAPPAPANISWEFLGAEAIKFTWEANQYANYYVVYRVTDAGAADCALPSSTANCGDAGEATQSEHISIDFTWTDTSFTPGLSYDYVIVAFNNYGSTSSNSNSIQSIAPPPTISSADLDNSGLSLEWTDAAGADYYELFRYTESGCLSDDNADTFATRCANALRISNITSTEYLDTLSGVDTANVYYRLRSINASGVGALSEELNHELELLAPDEFTVSSNSAGDANYLNWTPVLLAESYTIYRYQDSICATQPELCVDLLTVDLASEILSYKDEDIDLGELYYYNLQANSSAIGSGDLSVTVDSVSAPTAAANLQAVAADGKVDLIWDDHNNSSETVYKIYRSTCIPGYDNCRDDYEIVVQFSVGSSLNGASSFADSEIDGAQQYYYIVSAEAGDWEVNSSTVSVITHPEAMGDLSASAVSSQAIRLSWDNPNGNQDDASSRIYVYTCEPSSNGCAPTTYEIGTGKIYSHTVEDLSAGRNYYFKLGVYTENTEVISSVSSAYTRVTRPYAISYEDSTIDSVVVSWSTDNSADTQYTLEAYLCDNGSNCTWDDSIAEPTYSTSAFYGGLYSGSAYQVRVRASAGGNSSDSDDALIYTVPVAADVDNNQFAVTEIKQTSVTLAWDININGSSSSYVPIRYSCDLLSGEQCSGLQLATFNIFTDSFTDTELNAGSTYNYQLRAFTEAAAADSAILSVTTAPPTPENLGTVAGDGNISLSWSLDGDGGYVYDAYQSELGCSAIELLDNDASVCGQITVKPEQAGATVFTDLLPATNYYYRVVARNTVNDAYSVSNQAMDSTWPRAPEAVAWSSDTDSITINWDVSSNGELATWKIYRYPCDPEDAACFDEAYTVSLDYGNSSYRDTHELVQGQEYFYVVSVLASYREFFSDSAIAVLTPYPPSDLSLLSGTTSLSTIADSAEQAGLYVELAWDTDNNAISTDYTIYRRGCSTYQDCPSYQFASYSQLRTYAITHAHDEQDISGTVRELIPAQEYYYTVGSSVTTSDGSRVEANSSTAVVTTHPVVVQELSTSSVSSSAIDVSWSAGNNGDQVSYDVNAYYCADANANSCGTLIGDYANLDNASQRVSDLAPATHYAFAVTARAGDGAATSALLTGSGTQPVEIDDDDIEISTYKQSDQAVVETSWTSDNGSAANYRRYLYECLSNSNCYKLSSVEGELGVDNNDVYTWRDDGLKLGSKYQVIIGVESGGVEVNSSVQEIATIPAAPTDLQAKDNGSGGIELTWNHDNNDLVSSVRYRAYAFGNACSSADLIADLEDYSSRVIDDLSDGDCAIAQEGAPSSKSFTFDLLAAGETYFFAVKALNDSGENWVADDEQITFTTRALPATPVLTLVGIEQGLEASFTSTDSTDDTSFTLHLSNSPCDDNSCSNTDHFFKDIVPDATLTLTNGSDGIASDYFTNGHTYYAYIEATNGVGSTYSAVVNATTTLSAVSTIIAIGGAQNITLDWDFTTGAVAYHARVYGESCGEDYMSKDHSGSLTIAGCGDTELHAVNVNDTTSSTTINGLSEGTRYYYRIGASSSDGSAFWSDEATMDTLPAAVTSASVSEPTLASIQVQWIDSSSPAVDRYDLYAFTGSTCSDTDLLALASSLNWRSGAIDTDTTCPNFRYVNNATSGELLAGLRMATTYYLRIASVNLAGSVFYSPELSLATSSALDEPLASEQWHLVNTETSNAFVHASYPGVTGIDINYSGVLATGLTGYDVRINIIDTGLDIQHPDLAANILADGSYDFVDDDNDPTNVEPTGDLGTSIAGIIGAAVNGQGVTGIAPKAWLQGFNYLQDKSEANFVTAVGDHDKLSDTDIFNIGFSDEQASDQRVASSWLDALSCFTSGGAFDITNPDFCPGENQALRSGLGAIYVKSAGDKFAEGDLSGDLSDDLCRQQDVSCYDASMDALHSYPYQIVVGALNANGVKSSSANAGASLWLTAPGGEYGWNKEYMYDQDAGIQLGSLGAEYWEPSIVTTDRIGCQYGYSTYQYQFTYVNPLQTDTSLNSGCDYTANFYPNAPISTSAATAKVSGVVALMLEANPDLTWRDVKHILARTARQVDAEIPAHSVPYMECTDSDCSALTASDSLSFLARDAWTTNAAGYSFHSWYGLGLVDAGAAATMALDYTSELGEWGVTSVDLASINATIPDADGNTASTTISVTDDLITEAVQLDLQLTHHYLGAIAVVLTSPGGTRSVLLTPYTRYDDDDDFDSTLLSNAFYGEPAAGDWQLEVYDLIQDADDVSPGTLDSATLNIYGHSQD